MDTSWQKFERRVSAIPEKFPVDSMLAIARDTFFCALWVLHFIYFMGQHIYQKCTRDDDPGETLRSAIRHRFTEVDSEDETTSEDDDSHYDDDQEDE